MVEKIINKRLYQQDGSNGIRRSVREAENGNITQVIDFQTQGGHIFTLVIDMDVPILFPGFGTADNHGKRLQDTMELQTAIQVSVQLPLLPIKV
jgi:hypothetical protein